MVPVVLAVSVVVAILVIWFQTPGDPFIEADITKTASRLSSRASSSDDRLWRNPKKTWITTHYDDTGSGVSSIPFAVYPLRWKGKTIWPAAVHERDNKYLYHVLSVTLPDKSKAFVHVMDFCNRCDKDCGNSVTIGGKKYTKPKYLLLDIHEKAFGSKGFKGSPRNTYNPKVKSVGVITPNQITSLSKGLYVIDGKKRCSRNTLRKTNCNDEEDKDFFGDYCRWAKV